jgi:hypothetical protein
VSDDLFRSLKSIADRFLVLSSQDEELRRAVRQLAQVLLTATEAASEPLPCPLEPLSSSPEQAPSSVGYANAVPEPVLEVEPVVVAIDSSPQVDGGVKGAESERGTVRLPEEPREPLPELTLGRSSPAPMLVPVRHPVAAIQSAEDDFVLIASRCRLKAEGARWAAERRRLLIEGAHFATLIDPRDKEIISRAKSLPDCFLWMCHPSGPAPADLSKFDVIAGCFDGLAEIVALVHQIQAQRALPNGQPAGRMWEESLYLLAEAQSALRVAIASIVGLKDHDQLHVFDWLKRTCSESHIYLDKYMQSDAPADPSQWMELTSRIEAQATAFQENKKRSKAKRKLLGKIRYKVSQVSELPEEAVQEAIDQWRLIAQVIEELLGEGVPPSDRELRELLLPAIDGMPDLVDIPKGLRLVLREIDRVVANSPTQVERAIRTPTPELLEAARLLSGRSIVLIGGTRRPGSHQAIEEAFGLRELIWIEPREHQSIDSFESHVARSDVAVVLLAIRWSSHSFSDVLEFCDRHNKLMVRLPKGYNPNEVASQIMGQCSDRLRQV